MKQMPPPPPPAPTPAMRRAYTAWDEKTEVLPSRSIEGVMAEGKRVTRTIPAGAIGNEQPIVSVTEEWRSPELQVLVMTRTSDPRTGESVYKLQNIIARGTQHFVVRSACGLLDSRRPAFAGSCPLSSRAPLLSRGASRSAP